MADAGIGGSSIDVQTMEVICVQCTEKFFVRNPALEVINGSTVSILCWAHPETQNCPNCGQAYQFAVVGVGGVSIQWRVMKEQISASRITMAPPGMKV